MQLTEEEIVNLDRLRAIKKYVKVLISMAYKKLTDKVTSKSFKGKHPVSDQVLAYTLAADLSLFLTMETVRRYHPERMKEMVDYINTGLGKQGYKIVEE